MTGLLSLVIVSFLTSLVSVTDARDAASVKRAAPKPVAETVDESVPVLVRHQAERMRARLARDNFITPSVASLIRTLASRRLQLESQLSVNFITDAGEAAAPATWTVKVSEHPEWLQPKVSAFGVEFAPNADVIASQLMQTAPHGMKYAQDARITGTVKDGRGIVRVTTDVQPVAGYTLDAKTLGRVISDALRTGTTTVSFQVSYREPVVTDAEGRQLRLISAGVSNFAKSPENRIWNVRKSINEHVNGLVVAQGQTFSFNSILGGPVTLDKGWKEALGLFGGGAAMTPGGGICQAATTVYRAAVLAGLPITERKPHSLYVSYYEKFGLGIDATIFPGKVDLAFRNDTPGDLYIFSHIVGEDVFVSMYGTADQRTVSMRGPFFTSNTPADFRAAKGVLGFNQIGWVQEVQYADGTVRKNYIISTYKHPIPHSVVTKYKGSDMGLKDLHASTPLAMN